jgi:hypothetical protein
VSNWNEIQAAHDRDVVRGFPFSKEAERRLAVVETQAELELRYDACMAEFDEIADLLERLASACGSLANKYDAIGHRPLVPEGLRGGISELQDLAHQVRAVRKAVEYA